MLLVVEDVHASYGRFDVLRGLSVRVARGELVAILGPNGAGKSTLLKTVAGFLTPRQGSIRFGGEEVGGLRPPALLRKGIAYVMQRTSLFPKMTIQENLELGAYIRETTDAVREDIERVLALFPRLAERRQQRAEGLSGGERRMLEIGRALLLRPTLLLLDEPTMGLAPLVMDLIFDKILEVRARCPELRFGQLIATIGMLAEDETGLSLWDVEDADFVAALERFGADMARRGSPPAAPGASPDGGVPSSPAATGPQPPQQVR